MRSVAFLRAINLGGNTSVKMADLRSLFEEAGYTDVSTHLQSGNVMFGHDEPVDVAALEKLLANRFGFSIPVILRTKPEIQAALDAAPFDPADEDYSHQFITFLKEPFVGDLPPDPPKGGAAYLGKTEREIFSRWWMVNGKYEIPTAPNSLREGTTRNRRVTMAIAEKL